MNTSTAVRRVQRQQALGLSTLVLAAVAAFAASPAADAGEPVRGCQPRYNLTEATFSVVTAFVDFTGNQDGWVCRMVSHNGVNVIDNHIPLR